MNAHYLRRTRRVDGTNSLGGFEALAANDERILATEMRRHLIEGMTHGAHIFRIVKVDERIVRKSALGRTQLDSGRNTGNSHNDTFFWQFKPNHFTTIHRRNSNRDLVCRVATASG
jgi:hypothetical protein